jgi:hypothetical protein
MVVGGGGENKKVAARVTGCFMWKIAQKVSQSGGNKLGEFLYILLGKLLPRKLFCKIAEVAHSFLQLFLIWTIFFTKPSGHPDPNLYFVKFIA